MNLFPDFWWIGFGQWDGLVVDLVSR